MTTKINYKRGDIVTYQKEIRFKGIEKVKAKIVAIGSRTILLDNGDEILVF